MNTIPSNQGGKSLSASASSFNPSQPFSIPSPSFESNSRRAAVASPALAYSGPRKAQASRKQHKDKKRPLRESRLDEDDAMAEFRAMRNPTGRKGQTSITHLLNYSTPLRHSHDHGYGHGHGHGYGRSSRRQPTWGPGSGYHPADKAKFVHANYRFVVDPQGEYAAQASDADKPLDWNNVQQIIASTESQSTSCPICLSDPVAPRMARCGHIFCLPCMIRFMNSTSDDEASSRKETRYKKCPICEDSFKIPETRPVRFYAGQESPLPGPGHDVVLRLMVRESSSTLALPNEGGNDPVNEGEVVPWHFAANVLDYARIMKGTPDYMVAEFDREIDDLRKQSSEDEIQFGAEDGDWTIRAIRAITTAKDKLKEPKPNDSSDAALPNGSTKAQSKRPASHPFHFYSAHPHLYLSPLDIRILKAKFGDYSNFPSTLLPRVEHVSTGHVVDDVLRKRTKYLAHLPQGCVVNFLECDWTDIVPAEILDTFATELEKRRKSHRDKDAQEERERVQAERIEAASIGRSTRHHFESNHVEPYDPTPALSSDDFQPLASTTPPNPRPGFEQLAEMSTSPSTSKTVWGTRAIAASPDLGPVPESSGHDGWLKDDEFLGAAEIALQMEAFHIDGEASGPSTQSGGGGKKKKKQKQKITLMSTGGHRGN
ncbi:RING-15 protein [Pestalotiopsis sp. NC0098]|nr:RING-15 protein [Pestalotiopsis sp. NC0098]